MSIQQSIGRDIGKGEGHMLKRLAGRNLLFSEVQQSIYELDDLCAFVWFARRRGLTPMAIVDEMVSEGTDRTLAEDLVGKCMNQLRRLLPG